MSNIYFYFLLALIVGAMMPTQAAVNTKMVTFVDNPLLAAFISFFVGTVGLLVVLIATGTPLGSLASAKNAPPVAWIGGLLGAVFVTAAVMLVPRLGVTMTFCLFIAGQMLISLVYDNFGVLGVPVKEVSLMRVLGIILITGGVVLIRKF